MRLKHKGFCACVPQVKGHLDYMKQMDTILVAVGMPTREAPGASASFGLLNSVTIREPDPNLADPQTPSSQPSATTESEGGGGGERETEGGGEMEGWGQEETGDGWDIPDISDLLESLDDDSGGDQSPPPTGPRAPDSPTEDGENLSLEWGNAAWTPWTPESKHVRGNGAGKPNT